MSDWHVWLFYGTAVFISVYSVITWKQIMWLYTLASPYGVDDNDVAIKMFSWSALRQLAASTFSIPAFILLGQKCISSIPTEFVTVPFTLVIATVIYTLGCSYSAPEKAFYRLKKYGYLAEDATGNGGVDRIYHSPFYAIYLWDGPIPYRHYCSVYISSVYSVILACYTKMLYNDFAVPDANTSIGVLGIEHGSFVRR